MRTETLGRLVDKPSEGIGEVSELTQRTKPPNPARELKIRWVKGPTQSNVGDS